MSVITFAERLIVVPLSVVHIPEDHFARRAKQGRMWADHHPAVQWILIIGKNALGNVLIEVGILMLVLPGQDALTILIGILFMDFPGKCWLERWIVSHGPVLQSINWLRQRAGREPLVLEKRNKISLDITIVK